MVELTNVDILLFRFNMCMALFNFKLNQIGHHHIIYHSFKMVFKASFQLLVEENIIRIQNDRKLYDSQCGSNVATKAPYAFAR